MSLTDFSIIASMLLAISLATERAVAIVKTVLPSWFAEEKKTAVKEVDLIGDRPRRLRVQAVALAAAWATASFLAVNKSGAAGWDPFGSVALGNIRLPAVLVGLLASGGSAFWAQVVAYSSSMKDVATTRKASTSLALGVQAQQMGLSEGGAAKRAAEVKRTCVEHIRTLLRNPPARITDPAVREV